MPSRVLLLGSKEAEEAEEEAKQNLEIAFRLLIDTDGWVLGSLEGSPGVTHVGVSSHWGVALGLGQG